MKSTLIRILAIMTLATSLSAVAQPANKAKKADCSNASSETATAPDVKADQKDNGREKSKQERMIEEQNKQWLHDVQNIVGG